MADQTRDNKDKTQLHYWYSTYAADVLLKLPLEILGGAPTATAEKVLHELAAFLRTPSAGVPLRTAALAAVNAGHDPGELYSRVCMFGAKKYARGNFRKGAGVCSYADSALRHLMRILAGEDTDPESGLPHIGHALWNIVQMFEIQVRPDAWAGRDDRLCHCGEYMG